MHADFRRGVPRLRTEASDEAVEIDPSDFCQCDYPRPSDWGPEHCGECKRLVLWNDPEYPYDPNLFD